MIGDRYHSGLERLRKSEAKFIEILHYFVRIYPTKGMDKNDEATLS